MQVKDFKISADLIDNTPLDEDEIQVASKLLIIYGPVLLEGLLNRGANPALQLAVGLGLRAAKANLEQGLQIATLEDVKNLGS